MARGKKFQCAEFFTSTHSELMNEIDKYLSYEDKIERGRVWKSFGRF